MTDVPAPSPQVRYLYTDPLAAAWMAKQFGMRFCDRTGFSVSADPSMWYMADRHHIAGSLYVHPDSLHLLEPQQDDLGLATNTNNLTVAFFRGIKWWALYGI